MNPYLNHINNTLPRVLALFDQDRTSASYGMGDRYHWAWGLIDFSNAVFQGAAHGISRLFKHGMFPYPTTYSNIVDRIDSMFVASRYLTNIDGSLNQAFPNEGSYAGTAFVAFDLLCALDIMHGGSDDQFAAWSEIVRPMIGFLIRADETHGLISNHLATAVAALVRWHRLTNDEQALAKADELLQRILQNQSTEGWFVEYQGADPGYQSLCTYYLADVQEQRPDWGLLPPLRKSIQFLWNFAHPDGSFGGLYGSRCTRFYNPAGIESLAPEIPEAHALAEYMAGSIAQNRVVTLSSIDEPNLIPWFNAYCRAAVLYEQRKGGDKSKLQVPCMQATVQRRHYAHAGLLIDQGPEHYSVVSTHKGGVVYHYQHGKAVIQDTGIVVRDKKGTAASTQGYCPDNPVQVSNDTLTVQARFQVMPRRLPTPFQFMALRLLCLTVFRSRTLRELVKRILVKLLITGKKTLPGGNTRTITLGPDLSIEDKTDPPPGYQKMDNPGPFVAIHMASQGYWQVQDEGG